MVRKIYFSIVFFGFVYIAATILFNLSISWLISIWLVYTILGFYDIYISRHNILTNYPVIGHLKYMLEFISPEIHQYFIENSHDGRPYNREQRNIIYSRAANTGKTMPFGTQFDLLESGNEFSYHSLSPCRVEKSASHIWIGKDTSKKPYLASRLNISAMSFGALSMNAIRALNRGACQGGFYHNTGEGGMSPYHLQEGGDICWQIGTGYFGCRTKEGNFDPEAFQANASRNQVKMIEVKLSQGAKPSHGGILPAAKVSQEIARIRMVPASEDCISPATHSEFSSPLGLLQFIEKLKQLSGGKPVGFKLCIGKREEFLGIVKAMDKTGIIPDFITVDGAEGGTGAAPFEFSDSLGLPLNEGLNFVHNALVGANLRKNICLIASGKVITGFDMIVKMALGANLINMARPMMFALGCIQARRCNTNTCPSGVATQDPKRGRAVNVNLRAEYIQNFHSNSIESYLLLLGAMGFCSPEALQAKDIFRRLSDIHVKSYAHLLPQLEPGELLKSDLNDAWKNYWQFAAMDHF